MNQLFDLLKKEVGNVGVVSIRRVPRVKDGDAQDDIDIWEMEARERGIMFDDDSPENTKAPVSNQTVARNLDLTRTNEIQSRYNLAIQIKNECWELIGLNRQRIGAVQATETATGTNTALTQSYAQTEPLFAAHEYVLNQVYQAIIDASKYVEAQKPVSTISYITNEGELASAEIMGEDLTNRDLKVFVTSRPEDVQAFNELRLLAQPLLQNGGSFEDVIQLYSTNSVRQMKEVFARLRKKQEEMQERQQQLEEQKLQQAKEQFEQAQVQAQQERQEDIANENYNKELDRLNKKEVALINALGRNENATQDTDNSGVADALEITRMQHEKDVALRDYNTKQTEIANKAQETKEKLALEYEKLEVDRENMKNDLLIAKQNAKNRNTKKPTKKK